MIPDDSFPPVAQHVGTATQDAVRDIVVTADNGAIGVGRSDKSMIAAKYTSKGEPDDNYGSAGKVRLFENQDGLAFKCILDGSELVTVGRIADASGKYATFSFAAC